MGFFPFHPCKKYKNITNVHVVCYVNKLIYLQNPVQQFSQHSENMF